MPCAGRRTWRSTSSRCRAVRRPRTCPATRWRPPRSRARRKSPGSEAARRAVNRVARHALMADGAERAYVAGLTLLSRRELAEAQLRERLARRKFEADDVDEGSARARRA